MNCAGIPAFGKLEAIRALMAAYRVQSAPTPAVSPVQPSTFAPRSPERPGTLGGTLAVVAEAYLRRVGRRAQVSEIMEAVQAEGITMRGAKPISTLSSFLSHHQAFDNVRGEGYGLTEWNGTSPRGTTLGHSEVNLPFTRPVAAYDNPVNDAAPDKRDAEQRGQGQPTLADADDPSARTESA